MTTNPVAVRVSQATRLMGSSARQASRTASEIWSAILSGWPSVTDSEVKRVRFLADKLASPSSDSVTSGGENTEHQGRETNHQTISKRLTEKDIRSNEIWAGWLAGALHR